MANSAFDDQLMYKLATIETKVAGIGDTLSAAIARLESRIADGVRQSADNLASHKEAQTTAITEIKARVKVNEDRIDKFEEWKNIVVAKVGGVTAVAIAAWALFGHTIQTKMEAIF